MSRVILELIPEYVKFSEDELYGRIILLAERAVSIAAEVVQAVKAEMHR